MHAADAVPRIGGPSIPEGEQGPATHIAGIPVALLDAHRLTLTVDDTQHLVLPACTCGVLEPPAPIPLALTTRTLARQHANHLLEVDKQQHTQANRANTNHHATNTR